MLKRSGLLMLCLLVTSCGHKLVPEARTPASVFDSFENHVELVKEFVSPNTYGKNIRYKMSFAFTTSMDKSYLRESARQALDFAIQKTLGVSEKMIQEDSGKENLASRFKTNLTESLLKEFVKTLYVYKIVNGAIQVSLSFSAEPDSPYGFQNELANNHLVNFGDSTSASQKMEALLNQSETNKAANIVYNPLIKNELKGEDKVFVGGNITLWLKILDLNWEPFSQPIPKPKQNAVKGFVRLRKFYSLREGSSGFNCADAKPISTEDIYLDFNLANMKPQASQKIITQGRFLPYHAGIEGLLEDASLSKDLGFPSQSKECVSKESF